jgi:hypothetical protein
MVFFLFHFKKSKLKKTLLFFLSIYTIMTIINKERLKSLLKKLEVPQDNDVSTQSNWINRDLAPIPPGKLIL